ncbi:LLM class flavin-dependent oxidoreductase [Amycolatopsis viridis]|uniref:Alkanesulfonate monooxygenase SsuD/methylene tetrahydromethanopterin reductase-like flavin-dependent oxidoreductase (Luciferase family) n=1 Tax=Amycolatopsis viridis TaxID=185678 RepID=A0ABX0SV72_9PSEU|nr:LLM class flavin-dependent oxidoreductase [Amycolatopsis viridis]NIH80868.1 alkanesulfonate monooxygenase SsuD/methylene tetrahydromethanopterin reductase-like flavin-dependent oxidoreductase (luciferase family) [Amycolatopsis viridis]
MNTRSGRLRVGLALDGAGWHPCAWQVTSVSRPADLFGAGFWTGLARRAEAGGAAFVTVEDGISLQSERFGTPDRRGDQVRGRLDPVVAAALLLSATERIEVVVSRNVTHHQPFQVAAQLASLAAIAPGRVVWRPQVSANAADAAVAGGRATPVLQPEDIYVPTKIARRLHTLFDDAEDFVRAVRQLWASFPGDSLAGSGDGTPRSFVDPERVGTVRAAAGRYQADGPLNVPVLATPPVAVLAHHALEPYRLAAAVADRVFVTPGEESLTEITQVLRGIERLTPGATPTEVYADVAVVLGDTAAHARQRRAELEDLAGAAWTTDTSVFTGTAAELRDLLATWADQGLDGVRVRPAVIPEDADRVVTDLLPLLRDPSAR